MDIEDAYLIIKPLPLFQGGSQPVNVLKKKKMYERKVCLIKLRVVFLGQDWLFKGKERRDVIGEALPWLLALLFCHSSCHIAHNTWTMALSNWELKKL